MTYFLLFNFPLMEITVTALPNRGPLGLVKFYNSDNFVNFPCKRKLDYTWSTPMTFCRALTDSHKSVGSDDQRMILAVRGACSSHFATQAPLNYCSTSTQNH